MKKLGLHIIFNSAFLILNSFCFSQNVDSLKLALKNAKQDTNRVNALSELSQALGGSNPDTALILGNQALVLAQKLNYKKAEAWAEFRVGRTYDFKQNYKDALPHYNKALVLSQALLSSKSPNDILLAKKLMGIILGNIGVLYHDQFDYPKALEYYFKGLKIAEEVGDKQGAGIALGNIGMVYHNQFDSPKAMEYYFKGLKIAEEVGDKQGVDIALGNIGMLYKEQSDYPKALEYYFKGLKIAEELGDKLQVDGILNNIGLVYHDQSDYTKALEYYFKGLKIAEELRDKIQVGRILGNIANVYKEQSDYTKALEYYFNGLKIAEELGDKYGMGVTLGNIGSIYTTLGKYKEAELNLKNALAISLEIGEGDLEKDNHNYLSHLYEKTNRPALAFEHYKKYITLRDTIFSQENTKKLMHSEMNFQFEKQQAVADAKHKSDMEKQQALAEEKSRRQKIIIRSVGIGLFLVIIFAGFVFRSLRITRKQKELIDAKNAETEKQKHIIEEKQKEIIDSIKYARRIQTALLPSEKYIERNLQKLNRG